MLRLFFSDGRRCQGKGRRKDPLCPRGGERREEIRFSRRKTENREQKKMPSRVRPIGGLPGPGPRSEDLGPGGGSCRVDCLIQEEVLLLLLSSLLHLLRRFSSPCGPDIAENSPNSFTAGSSDSQRDSMRSRLFAQGSARLLAEQTVALCSDLLFAQQHSWELLGGPGLQPGLQPGVRLIEAGLCVFVPTVSFC